MGKYSGPPVSVRHFSGCLLHVFIIVFQSNTWIFTENSGQKHIDVVERPKPKSVRFIIHHQIAMPFISMLAAQERSWQMTYQFVTTMSASTRFGGGGKVEVARIEIQMAKSKIHDFAKSKKQAFGSALLASREKFHFFSDLSF